MINNYRSLAFLVIGFLGLINTADAMCQKSWVCDDYGMNCGLMDVCDSSTDLPSIDIQPLRPLPSLELKPLPSVSLPPLGTSECRYMQVNGRWQNICQ